MRGYLVQPAGGVPLLSVLVMHENLRLNPHMQDVARRFAVAGFLALAPNGLWPVGGYPGIDDEGREMQRTLDQESLRQDMVNGARFVRSHALLNGKLGATRFCWGGGTTNFLAMELGEDLNAGAPFYGSAATTDKVSQIKEAVQMHYAEEDEQVNAMREDCKTALKANNVIYEMHMYAGTWHGYHYYSTPRHDLKEAQQAWERLVGFFKRHVS